MINVILSGANGKMGRVIENCISLRNDMQIICGVDVNTTKYADFPIYSTISDCLFFDVQKADVVIDFSHPNALDKTLEYCFQNDVALVAATTGYTNEQIEKIKQAAKKIPVFFTFNMSLGINLLIELAKKATSILGDQFDIEIVEKHHNQKIDAPSGTAVMLANAINETADNTYNYEYDRHSKRQKRNKNEIGIHSIRGGTIVGEHDVIFAGRDETLTLSHSAASKEVFAVGAVKAAAFVAKKPAGLYDMKGML